MRHVAAREQWHLAQQQARARFDAWSKRTIESVMSGFFEVAARPVGGF